MKKWRLSPYVREILDKESGLTMVYHALVGCPQVLDINGVQFLQLFQDSKTVLDVQEFCDGESAPLIEKFVSLHLLVETGTDEKALIRQRQQEHLLHVQQRQTVDRMGLAISDACNFGCNHCIHFQPQDGKVLPDYQVGSHPLQMEWAVAKKCVDEYVSIIRAQGKTACKIHFGNAEPLLNWPVIQQVLEYCEKMSNLQFSFAVNTNLTLLTREMAEIFKRHRVAIATSLDGSKEANDAIRTTKRGMATYDDIIAKFDMLVDIGYPLDGFSITVTAGNFYLIDIDIIDIAIKRGMKNIAFDYDLVGLTHVPIDDRVEKLMRLKCYADRYDIDFYGTWDSAYRNLTSGSLLDGNQFFCAAVEGKNLEFGVDGSIKVCGHTTTKIGHIDSFDQIFERQGGLYQMVQQRMPGTDEYCSGCMIEGPCGGQCHVTRESVARAADNEQQRLFADLCNFYRAITTALAVDYLRKHATSVLV